MLPAGHTRGRTVRKPSDAPLALRLLRRQSFGSIFEGYSVLDIRPWQRIRHPCGRSRPVRRSNCRIAALHLTAAEIRSRVGGSTSGYWFDPDHGDRSGGEPIHRKA